MSTKWMMMQPRSCTDAVNSDEMQRNCEIVDIKKNMCGSTLIPEAHPNGEKKTDENELC